MPRAEHPTTPAPAGRVTPAEAERLERTGAWTTAPLAEHFRAAVREHPGTLAMVGYDPVTRESVRYSYAEIGDLVSRLGAGLRGLGLRSGDGVAVMLPNCVEFAATIWAIIENGGVYTGIPSAYGEREATFMLRRTRARILVVPAAYKGTDWLGLARRLREAAPDLEQVVVVGGAAPDEPGFSSYGELASSPATTDAAPAVDPRALVHVGFTSGTTGEPKGVMNSHQTLDAVMRRWAAHVGADVLAPGVVNLVASPVGHHTGFLWGVLLTPMVRGTAVFVDRWDPAWVLDVIDREAVTMMVGAPTFLQDLVRAQDERGAAGDSPLRMVAVAGAPLPRSLPAEGRRAFGCFVCPAWGMTEYGIGISAAPEHGDERISATDGVPVEGCEARVVDAGGAAVPDGEEGDLEIRGDGLFLGYLDRPDFTAEAFRDGWFATGDRAVRREDGHIALQGRSKDLVIRGGENIPVAEVESLLYEHPDVVDVAVVGVPDERLGERCCAVVVVREGASIGLPGATEYLLGRGLSKHFLPEMVAVVDALPKTMSGKVKKAELRERYAAGVPS